MPIDTNLGLTAEQYYYYSGLLGPPFVPVPPELQRYFTRLMSSASSHYTIPAVTTTGDFTGSILVEMTPLTGASTYFSGAISSENSIILDRLANGDVRFFAFAGISLQSVAIVNAPEDGMLREIEFSLTGTTATLTVQGVGTSSATWNLTGSETIDFIGRRGVGSNYATGITANVNFISGFTQVGNPNAAIDGILYRLDADFSTTTVARNANSSTGAGDGTAVNIGTDDSTLFDQVSDGWDRAGGWKNANPSGRLYYSKRSNRTCFWEYVYILNS